jgi:hypothetical protein
MELLGFLNLKIQSIFHVGGGHHFELREKSFQWGGGGTFLGAWPIVATTTSGFSIGGRLALRRPMIDHS